GRRAARAGAGAGWAGAASRAVATWSMPTTGPTATTPSATVKVSGVAGHQPSTQPATSATRNTALAAWASSERARADVTPTHRRARAAALPTQDGRGGALDVLVGGRPAADRHAHGLPAVPDRAAHPAGPVALGGGDHVRRPLAERDQHLVEHDVV